MPDYQLRTTFTGRQKIVAALADGDTVQLSEVAIGDGGGSPVDFQYNTVALVNEVYRGDIVAELTHPDDPTVRGLTYTIPANSGGYVIREIGIFDTEGDLILYAPHPEFEKPADGSAFALVLAGTAWLRVTDADALGLVVTIEDGVPQSRVLTGGLGIKPIGNLSEDREVALDLTELTAVSALPTDALFSTVHPAGATDAERQPLVPLPVLDRRWRQRPVDLLWFGQF